MLESCVFAVRCSSVSLAAFDNLLAYFAWSAVYAVAVSSAFSSALDESINGANDVNGVYLQYSTMYQRSMSMVRVCSVHNAYKEKQMHPQHAS